MARGFNLLNQMNESKSVVGLNILGLWDDRGSLRQWIAPVSEALAQGVVKPVVHAVVSFDDAAGAHRILAARENVGKIVLVP